MKTWKKWLIAVFSIILVAGITLGTIWLVNNWDALTSDTTLYTQEDIDDAYEQGLNDAGYEVILQYQEQIAIIQGQLEESQIKIGNLTDSLNQALAQHEIDQETIAGYLEDIADLNDNIFSLNNQLTYYQELLEAYESSNKYIVTFYLIQNGNQSVYDVQTIEPNGYLAEVVTPEGNFEGWSLTIGGEVIEDITTIQVTSNMSIYGSFKNTYTVNFIVKDDVFNTQSIVEGEEINLNNYSPTLTNCNFEGWSLSINGEIISNNLFIVNDNVNFYAIITCEVDLSYNSQSYNYTVQYNSNLLDVLPTLSSEESKSFMIYGWYDSDNIKVEVEDFLVKENISLVAKFARYISLEFNQENLNINQLNSNVVLISAECGSMNINNYPNTDICINGEWIIKQDDGFVYQGCSIRMTYDGNNSFAFFITNDNGVNLSLLNITSIKVLLTSSLMEYSPEIS